MKTCPYMYAMGGLALASHAIGSMGADPEFLRLLECWFPGFHGLQR